PARSRQARVVVLPAPQGPQTITPVPCRSAAAWKMISPWFSWLRSIGQLDDVVTVGVGAVLSLWAVGGLAILGGRQRMRRIPLPWIARAAALVMTILGVLTAIHAITG
ncbi:MAG: hypothetical protein ACRDQZ_23980, partial [Mycobacteriales bacterium]